MEEANYLDGNGTDTLRFIYHVTKPLAVTDLQVYGPGAIEYGSSVLICRNSSVGVPANTTIPEPYDGTYASGDVIDIVVQFVRYVTVVGTPRLLLEGSGSGSGIGG
eukprot:gene39570-52188_t